MDAITFDIKVDSPDGVTRTFKFSALVETDWYYRCSHCQSERMTEEECYRHVCTNISRKADLFDSLRKLSEKSKTLR